MLPKITQQVLDAINDCNLSAWKLREATDMNQLLSAQFELSLACSKLHDALIALDNGNS